MKHWYPVLFLLAVSTSAIGQRYAAVNEDIFKGGIRFNLLGLVDPFDNNISAGGEYYFQRRWSVTADMAYVFLSEYLSQNKRTTGFIFRPGIRHYISDNRKGFLEAVAFYKGVGYHLEDWLGKDLVDGVPSYDVLQKFTFAKRVLGANLQAGAAVNLTSDNALRLELYGGLGIRFKWQYIRNEPNARYQRSSFFSNEMTNRYHVTSSLPLGLRLVYRIEK